MTQTNSQIREEFNQDFCVDRLCIYYPEPEDGEVSLDKIADWWLNKLDSLLKTQREEMIEKIENLPLNLEEGNERHKIFAIGFETAKENILSIIKEQ